MTMEDTEKPQQGLSPVLFVGLLLVVIVIAVVVIVAALSDTTKQTLPKTAAEKVMESLAKRVLADVVRIKAGDDIQSVVDSQPPGTVFVIGAGVYRLQSIEPKDGDVFIGEDGAVLNGAQLLEAFEQEGDYWVAANQTQNPWNAGSCFPGYEGCSQAYDVYIDDQPLQPVLALGDVKPGTWYFDYDADKVYMADNPNGRKVEISTAFEAFKGSASDVVINNLTIEKYAGPGQIGALRGADSTDWVVMDCLIQLNSGAGLNFGHGMQILNNRVVNNGQIGVTGVGDNVLVEGNEIAYNNYAHYNSGWEAGGTKFANTRGLVVRNNYVHHNDGPGLWTDINNIDVLYEGNLVAYNARMGIFHEISYKAIIRDNVAMFNSVDYMPWVYGGQILLSSSQDTEVYNNRVVVSADGGNGIIVLQQDRGTGEYGPLLAQNNYVHDNTVVFLGDAGGSGAGADWEVESFFEMGNNRFDSNHYYVTDQQQMHWEWDSAKHDWNGLRALGQEANGKLSTDITLDLLVVPVWHG